jgi:hypothetical protein
VTTGVAGFATAGTVTGFVNFLGDSAIEFLSGQISTIATGSQLVLRRNAFVEDSTALGSNSALTGLADIAGSLDLGYRASVSTAGSLTDNGSILLDWFHGTGGTMGGSTLSIGGALTNKGTLAGC